MLPSKFRIFDAQSVNSTGTYEMPDSKRNISRLREIKPEIGLIIKLDKNARAQRKRNLGGVNRTTNAATPYEDRNYERPDGKKSALFNAQYGSGTQ